MRVPAIPGRPGRAAGRLAPGGPNSPVEPGESRISFFTPALETRGSDPSAVGWIAARGLPYGFVPPDRPGVWTTVPEVLRHGDRVELDGTEGILDLINVEEVGVVTAFVRRSDGRVLLVRRSASIGSFPGHWSGISGHLDGWPPIRRALAEIGEETGIPASALRLSREGARVAVRGGRTVYWVHPVEFDTGESTVRLNWENDAFEWVEPGHEEPRPTVPGLWTVWRALSSQRPEGQG